MSQPVVNAFTVDVENWCHASTQDFHSLPQTEQRDGVMRGLDVLLDLLDRRRVRGTFFVLASVAEAVPAIVRRLRDGGHEIGSHGTDHRRVESMTPDQFEADLLRSREILEPQAGTSVVAYRSPMWSLYRARRWAFEILARRGFRYDSSLFPIAHAGSSALPSAPYDIRTPSGTVTEIPPLVVRGLWTRYPMGGTWGLRTFFHSDIRRATRRQNGRGHPAIFHVHPWELDPARPPLRQPFWTKVALTVRLTNLRARLDRLLGEFPFAPLTTVLNGVPRPVLSPENLP